MHRFHTEGESERTQMVSAFVVFRSMESVKLVKDAYKGYSLLYRAFVKLFKSCFEKRHAQIKARAFLGKWPKIKQAVELPENIHWENMGISSVNRSFRRVLVWVVALFISGLAFLAIMYLKSI